MPAQFVEFTFGGAGHNTVAGPSTVPSQSSSNPLQVSMRVPGVTLGTHRGIPETQCVVPAMHTPGDDEAQPTPPPGSPFRQFCTVRCHAAMPHMEDPRPLPTVPSQSLSMPLHVSGRGRPGMHGFGVPFTHAGTDRAQKPTPHIVIPRPLSTLPSQSL